MKKIICLLLTICLLLSLVACKSGKTDPTESGSSQTGTNQESENTNQQATPQPLIAVSVPAVTEDTVAEDGTVLFQYTYQSMSLVLNKPEVADKVILDFLNRVDSTKDAANTTAEMAKTAYKGNSSWSAYLYHVTYSPARIDNNVLSLFGNNVVFSGAGHPERTCVSASYDLQTGDVLTLASVMDKDATTEDFSKLVLNSLSEMAEGDYLYENYAETVKQRFATDPSQDEAWYFTQTGICFYFAPYEIAPYSSGVITVEIPYEKTVNILHDAYLPEARDKANGTATVTPFESVNQDDFSHIAEIITHKDGDMYMVGTDGSVQNVRITLTDNASNYTVFAAYNLSAGDGIMVQASQDALQKMKLSYKNGNETVTVKLIK